MRRIILSLFAVVAALSVVAANPSWEEQKQDNPMQERVDSESIEITVRDGYVYVTTTQPITVKIFSILGQLISQENIQAGSFRFRLANRGIYILKAGTITRRITI